MMQAANPSSATNRRDGAKMIEPSSAQTKRMQDTVSESTFWRRRISNDVNRHANQDTLQRIVGMPWRELGDGAKEKDHHAQKQEHGVDRQICRAKPVVLARMREFVRQDPVSTAGGYWIARSSRAMTAQR